MATTPAPVLLAYRRQPAGRVPVWFMRQAGRSLPEYRALRGEGGVLDAVKKPEMAVELTLQPVRRYGVDAAILYSDITVPAHAVGTGTELVPGTGPVTDPPFRRPSDLRRLRPLEPELDTPWVLETVRALAATLPPDVPLIGFAGGPFTVASYLVEGRPSRTFTRTKAMMLGQPVLFRQLLDSVADLAVASLRSQVGAGARAVQLFDSWVGALTPHDYRTHVLPVTTRVLASLADLGVPRVLFGVGTGELLPLLAGAGPDVVGVDWRVPLDAARARLGPGVAVQGNLDPAVCLAPWPVVAPRVLDVLRRAGEGPGHVFNLGHGVLPETDPDVLARIVELVHGEIEGG
ncbi:MAG: uroporphyrinogen decarboxylase [Acidimicrobiales bacterium]